MSHNSPIRNFVGEHLAGACCTISRSRSYSLGESFDLPVAHLDASPDKVDGEVATVEYRTLAMGLQLVAQRRPHARHEFVHAERLGDVIVGAAIECRYLASLVAAARQDDNRNAVETRADRGEKIEPLHVRETEIENDEVGLLVEQFERSPPVQGFEDLIALRGKTHAQQFADRRFIIDHQHLLRRGAHAAGSKRLAVAGTGSLMVKTAPGRSERFAAATVPCIASTKPREMARPRPVPGRT